MTTLKLSVELKISKPDSFAETYCGAMFVNRTRI